MDDAGFVQLQKTIPLDADLTEISRAIRLVSLGGGNGIEFRLNTATALEIARRLDQPDAIRVVEPPAPAPLTSDLWMVFCVGGGLAGALRPVLALLWAWWAR